MSRMVVIGTPAYFAPRSTGWVFLPAGVRGVELPLGVLVLTTSDIEKTLGRPCRVDGEAIHLI